VNEVTLLTSIKTLLIAQTWSGGSVVFPSNSVYITANTEEATSFALKNLRAPIALIRPGTGASDPKFDELPDLIYLDVEVRIIQINPGDPVGENVLIGANKTQGTGRSEGRGLFEIEQQLYTAIGKLNAAQGITIQFRNKGALTAGTLENGTYLAYRDHTFQAICTMT